MCEKKWKNKELYIAIDLILADFVLVDFLINSWAALTIGFLLTNFFLLKNNDSKVKNIDG